MNQPVEGMLEYWSNIATNAALVLVVLSSAYYIFYVIIAAAISNRTKKYKFVQSKEVAVMKQASVGFAIAIALVINMLMLNERDFGHTFIFVMKAALPIGIAVTIGYAIWSYLIIYYPFILERKLSDIRFKERKNPKTGRPMRLLNEEEEDEYLTEEMIRQEDEFRFDFDVWLDETNKDTIIETYLGSTNRICGKCNFRTLKLTKEEIDEDTNVKMLYFNCTHCGHKEKEQDA
ncbi:MAG: hypothetical protein JXR07_03355 [Reichenbachiella sp.]